MRGRRPRTPRTSTILSTADTGWVVPIDHQLHAGAPRWRGGGPFAASGDDVIYVAHGHVQRRLPRSAGQRGPFPDSDRPSPVTVPNQQVFSCRAYPAHRFASSIWAAAAGIVLQNPNDGPQRQSRASGRRGQHPRRNGSGTLGLIGVRVTGGTAMASPAGSPGRAAATASILNVSRSLFDNNNAQRGRTAPGASAAAIYGHRRRRPVAQLHNDRFDRRRQPGRQRGRDRRRRERSR